MDVPVILKRFEQPDETRQLERGKFELVHLGGMSIGRATYQPGWKWSQHVGPALGLSRCSVEHVGLVLAGAATAAFEDGTVIELRAGELLHPAAAARQLGAGERTLRVAAFCRRAAVRTVR